MFISIRADRDSQLESLAAAIFLDGSNDAAASAAVLVADRPKPIYERAGDDAFTLAEFAAEVARQSGHKVEHVELSEADYEAALVHAGLPAPLAELLANAVAAAAARCRV